MVVSLLLLAACQQTDAYRRLDVWQPSGVNARNIAAMVANPHDLVRGHGDGAGRLLNARMAVGAIDMVAQDHVKPLLKASVAPTPAGGAN